MNRCINCFVTNKLPGSVFNEDGLCSACIYKQKKNKKIDWKRRLVSLKKICKKYRCIKNRNYDCIVPVSGGKDSTRQAFYVRDKLKMNPLLVSCAYPPEQQTDIGAYNIENLVSHGFDVHYISPSPNTWKKMMKYCFFQFGNIFKSCELALFATAPIVAIRENIKLIFYGENVSLQWGGDNQVSKNGNANNLKNNNTLSGGDISHYIKEGFNKNKLFWYDYPDKKSFNLSNLKMIFLGYYIPDFNDKQNSKFSIKRGLKVRHGFDADPKNTGTITNYDALDDDFVFINQMIKFCKFGMGKVAEQASAFVRDGELSKDKAKKLVDDFDGKCSEVYIEKFCKFLSISKEDFWKVVNKYRSKNF